jgi:hypothetical protein
MSTDLIINNESAIMPKQAELTQNFNDALQVVDDVVLKNYVSKLQNLDIIPLDDKEISDNIKENVRLFKITEMVYEKDEYATHKFASVFNSLSTANCAVFVMIDSDGEKTDFYMGIRSLNSERTTSSLEKTLKNAVEGQFPGTKTKDYLTKDIEKVISKIKTDNVSIVSCLANNKDDENKNNASFVQGLEKLALSMQGEKYTAIILANGTSQEQIESIRQGYEDIYTQLSPFANQQLAYSTNRSLSVSDAYTYGTSHSVSESYNRQETNGTSKSVTDSHSESVTKTDMASKAASGIAAAASGLGLALAPITGGLSLIVGGGISAAAGVAGSMLQDSKTRGTSHSETTQTNNSVTEGETHGTTDTDNESSTNTKSLQSGTTQNITLTLQNKKIQNILERLDTQLKRLQEFESLGMWECAGYFVSDIPYVAEIAASSYKAIMRGENSGVEVSAINSWGKGDEKQTAELAKYITNFMHPVFAYPNAQGSIEVTPCSLVSGNELAIHMGLPRKSVCGFPVMEHADFGKEIVSYNSGKVSDTINLGNVFNMGIETKKRVELKRESLAMHTFITGSTGSGKSNTVYEFLGQMRTVGIPFMVIEPAKGEYKNVFGNYSDVEVLGTNPEFSKMLRINPFKFPKGVHILEHIDRLIEIFNVCWPMYAAMPAVLKDAVLKSYEVCGWDLVKSKNRYDEELFPTFMDLQNELVTVINNSAYSQELKSNYTGSLLTRVKSLTNGLNGQIFGAKEVSNEKLFNSNVIIDLSRIGSLETKSLIMGILIMRMSEYRMTTVKEMNASLSHITVLEEAHNILKRTSTDQNPESSNMTGKSVEMISNAIAEMRTYGEGFIIADQSPNAVDISAIRNTNTKIIMRLPDETDRQLAGKAAALNDEQIDEIAKLPRGVAVVYQNDWIEPILCKVKEFKSSEELYRYIETEELCIDTNKFNTNLLKLLLKGRTVEQIEPNIDLLKEQLKNVTISSKDKLEIMSLIKEYEEIGKLTIWADEKFEILSELVTNLIADEHIIDNIVLSSSDFEKVTQLMIEQIKENTDNLSIQLMYSVCQCFMKSFSKGSSEKLEVYAAWREEIVDKGVF